MRDTDDIARTRAFWMATPPGTGSNAPARSVEPPALWRAALALALALVAQTTILPLVAFHGTFPSLATLVVFWYGVRSGTWPGFAFGLVAGTCEDALAGATGIAWTFATGLVGAIAGRIANTWVADLSLVLVPVVASLTIVRFGAFALAMQAQGRPLVLPVVHFHAVLAQALANAAIAFVALRLRPTIVTNDAHGR